MAKIRINGDTSGYIEISAPAVAGSTSITLPATTGGSLLATDASGNLNVDSGTFYIDGTNNRAGIGTTSPTVPLEVSATGAGIKNIINVKPGISTTGEGGAITFSNLDPASNQLAKIAAVFEGGTFSGSLRFYTNTDTEGASPSEKMRITPTGRVGIGTISPGAGLHISTTGQTTSALDTSSNLNLLVSDTGTSAGNGGSIVFGFNTGAGKFAAIKGQVITGAGNSIGDLAFSTRNATGDSTLTERLRITYDGKVGIGTASVGALLHLSQTAGNAKLLIQRGDTASNSDDYGSILWRSSGGYNNGSIGVARQSGEDNGYMYFSTGSGGALSERARIDSSGRLLVGTSTAVGNARIQLQGNASDETALLDLRLANNNPNSGTTIGSIRFSDTNAGNGQYASIACAADAGTGSADFPGRLVFSTTADGASSPTERMRIDNGGSVMVGMTSNNYLAADSGVILQANGVARFGSDGTSARNIVSFVNGTDGTPAEVGRIQTNGSATSYLTSSDYRLKENVISINDGIDRLKQLKPSRFNFLIDPAKTVDGFLAHEVQGIVPEAIDGKKDAVDDDGNPVYQGIDQSKLVPLLTAALQEAIGRIESLEAEVTALKAQ